MCQRVLAIALLWFGVGCTDRGITRASYGDDVADARCDLLAECGCLETPPDECKSQSRSLWDRIEADAAEAGLSFDADCAARTLEVLSDTSCEDQAWAQEPGAACKIYFGPNAVGDGCESPESFDTCGQGTRCVGGICRDSTNPPGEGESCLGEVFPVECQDGLQCTVTADAETGEFTGFCETRATLGQPCDDKACEGGLDCFGEPGSRTCVAAHAEGEECERVCAEGLYCDGSPRICQPLKADGEPCSALTECLSLQCDETCRPLGACGLTLDPGE